MDKTASADNFMFTLQRVYDGIEINEFDVKI